MKSNRLTNILLVAVLAVLLSGRLPAASPTPVQPASAAAPAAPSGYIPQAGMVSGYVSVPAAAFHPHFSSYSYANYGTELVPENSSSYWYFAEVYLPDGATIDELSCIMRDYGPSSVGSCELFSMIVSGNNIGEGSVMGSAYSTHSNTAWTTYSTNSIDNAQVDNSRRAYFIQLDLPYSDTSHYIVFGSARIHYYYNAVYLPTVSK